LEDGAIKVRLGQESRHGTTTAPRRTAIIATAGILVVLILVGVAAFIGRQGSGQPGTTVGTSASSGELASAERLALPSTAGPEVSLAQMRGSPVVVYFYEGAG